MGFLTPLALLFAALSIPILLLYMLKLRRQEVLVSSTLLWQRLLRDRQANVPWQRLRRNLLMLLQLLILALLTLALARPFLPTATVASGSVVILLDVSASMQANDVPPSRFAAARQAARELLDGLGPGDAATLIAVGPQPTVLAAVTTDRTALRRALDEVAPSDGPADWEDACALAAASAAGRDAQTVILSDGAVPETLPSLPGTVHFVRVGERSDNLGIVTLAMREGSAGPQALLRVANSGDTSAQASVELRADGVLFDVRPLAIPPHASAALTLDDLPYDLSLLEARLVVDDPLPLDNVAWATPGRAAVRRVLLLTPGNLFLERALATLPGVELTRLAPDQPLPGEAYDLIVQDGPITQTLPAGNRWVIGPYGATSTVFTETAIVRTASDDPLLRYVDWRDVHVASAWTMDTPPGARVLVQAQGGPLLAVAERPEGRLAVLAFDLHQSDLPLQIAFPILVANLAGWLLPPGGAAGGEIVRAGNPLPIQPVADAARVIVSTPDGRRHELSIGQALPIFATTDHLGVYRAEQFDAAGTLLRSDPFAVNLFDPAESDIAPRPAVRVGQAEVRAAQPGAEGRREFWPWLAGAALGVGGVEWWVFHRGTRRRGNRVTRGRGDAVTG